MNEDYLKAVLLTMLHSLILLLERIPFDSKEQRKANKLIEGLGELSVQINSIKEGESIATDKKDYDN